MSSSSESQSDKRLPMLIISVGTVVIILVVVALSMSGNKESSPITQVSPITSKVPVSSSPSVNAVERMEPADVSSLISSKIDDPNFVIMDVRTAEEFAGGHIKGAQNLVDYYAADMPAKVGALDRTKTYLVYCRTGHRSGEIATLMQSLGFPKVYDLNGGITAWTRASMPSE